MPKHVREANGQVRCYYRSRPHHARLHAPPVCAECGRSLATRVWSRAAWERVQAVVARRRENARKRAEDMGKKKKPVNWQERVGKIMRAKGWGREDIAEATGASVRTVEGWDLGYHVPDRRSQRVLKALWRECLVAAERAAEARG